MGSARSDLAISTTLALLNPGKPVDTGLSFETVRFSEPRDEKKADDVIKQRFLDAQSAKSRKDKRTTPFLRRLIASTVDRVARDHYGAAYPTKCIQTSIAVRNLLARVGISSRVWLGAFCAAEVFQNPNVAGWGGFWGEDHHAWTTTEFYELIDLSVAELTQHPRSSRKDGIPMPPLWWDDIAIWPPIMKYLPDRAVEPAVPDPEDMADLERFLEAVDRRFSDTLQNQTVEGVKFAPMLHGPESIGRLYEANHPWLIRAAMFPERGMDFPPWIRAREQELIIANREGRRAPSRLGHVTGEVESA